MSVTMLRQGHSKTDCGKFVVLKSDEGWLSVSYWNDKGRNCLRYVRADEPDYQKVLQAIQ